MRHILARYVHTFPTLCTWRHDPEAFRDDLLLTLEHCYEIRTVGVYSSCVLVEHQQVIYWLNDNGGEINLGVLNGDHLQPDVATTAYHLPLDAGTIAYRISQRIHREDIDYAFRDPAMIETARVLAGQYQTGAR